MGFKRRLFKLWGRLPLPYWGRWLIVWLMTPKFLVGAMAVIFDDQGRVLLFHHTYRPDFPWALPSGWIKVNEYASDAIVREVYEESGLEIEAVRPLIVGGSKRERRIDAIFLCELIGGEFHPSAEVSEAQFFDLSALPVLLPYQRNMILQASGMSLMKRRAKDNGGDTRSRARG